MGISLRHARIPVAAGVARLKELWNVSDTGRLSHPVQPVLPSAWMLWVDGAGGWLVLRKERITIGGPAAEPEPGSPAPGRADLSLLAELSRIHATIVRREEGYLIEPHAAVAVCDRPIIGPTALQNGYDLKLGERVQLGFRLPTALSQSAVLDFHSVHRPAQSVDGVVLMHETLLLGAGSGNHIHCPGWSSQVVLFLREGQLWCRSPSPLRIDNRTAGNPAPLGPDAIVSGTDFCFRVEAVDLPAADS